MNKVDWRFVDYLMAHWAEWQLKNAWHTGHAPSSAIAAMIDGGCGTKNNGHRILCKDPPRQVQGTHVILAKLPGSQFNAVVAWYGYLQNEDGTQATRQQKASILGISETALSERLRRARKKVAKGLETATLIS